MLAATDSPHRISTQQQPLPATSCTPMRAQTPSAEATVGAMQSSSITTHLSPASNAYYRPPRVLSSSKSTTKMSVVPSKPAAVSTAASSTAAVSNQAKSSLPTPAASIPPKAVNGSSDQTNKEQPPIGIDVLKPESRNANNEYSEEMASLVTQVQSGLKARVAPIPVDDCTGGVYYLRSKNRRLTAVFKPADEEAYASNNPKHYHARVQSPSRSGMRQGIAAGDSAVREVVAYLLDRQHFAKVPATMLASAFHPDFHYQPSESPRRKVGALQAYVPHKDTADDVGSNLFSVADVHAIAMLDIRLANQDRHGGNILVVEQSPPTIKQPSGKQFALVPIDHGACLPRVSALSETSFLWLLWSQAKQPFSAAALEYIAALDVSRDLKLLETNLPKGYELEREAVLTLHVCTALLQFCALEHHMTAHAIGLLMCRQGTCHQQELKPSVLETLVASSLQDPAVFKSEALLKVQEKQQHQHSKLQLSPTAATSANTPVKTVNPHEKAWDTYVTTFMTAFRRELASHFAFK